MSNPTIQTKQELLHETEVWQWRISKTCLVQIRIHGQLSMDAIGKFGYLLDLQKENYPAQIEIVKRLETLT
jgi:hypothetical protein